MKNMIIALARFVLLNLPALCVLSTFSAAQVHINVNINQPPPLVANAGNDVTICSGTGDTLHASGGASYSWSPSNGLGCTICQSPFANPTTTTTYTVMVTGEHGCSGVDTVVVTVANKITAQAGPNVKICKGDSTTLLASGGTTYTWKPITGLSDPTIPNPKASPEVTTTYTVTVSGGGECNPDSAKLTVTVNPKPPVPTVTQAGSGGSTLRSSSPTGNQWYRNGALIPGATSQEYTVTQNGDYTVVVTDSNGCSSTSAPKKVTVGVETEVQKPKGTFVLFPNPNNGKFSFSFDADQKANYDIELRDILGRLIHQERLEKFIGHYFNRFDIAFYPKGFYSLSVRNGKEMIVMKVVTY